MWVEFRTGPNNYLERFDSGCYLSSSFSLLLKDRVEDEAGLEASRVRDHIPNTMFSCLSQQVTQAVAD